MKSKKWVLPVVYLLAAALIGACLSQFIEHWNWFQYSSEFNLFEFIYFLLSASLVAYIANILQKGEQDRRGEKDLFIERYKEIDEGLAKLLNSFVAKNKGEYTITHEDVVGQLKSVNMLIGRYQKALYRNYPDLDKKDTKYQALKLQQLRTLTTMDKRGDITIRCLSNVWYYNSDRMALINAEINRLRNACFDDVLLINAL